MEGHNTQGPDSQSWGDKKDQILLLSINPFCFTVAALKGLLNTVE